MAIAVPLRIKRVAVARIKNSHNDNIRNHPDRLRVGTGTRRQLLC